MADSGWRIARRRTQDLPGKPGSVANSARREDPQPTDTPNDPYLWRRLAAGSLGLQWLQYKLLIRAHPMEAWLVLLAVAFMALGIWAGVRLSRRPTVSEFEPNSRARETLGISDRELEVLELLAAGQSNKEIANQLNVSPNTVKTHIARLFDKLEVRRRTEAILRARELGMIR